MMRLRRFIATLLVVVQIAAVGLMTETKLMPVLLGIALALTYLPYRPRPLTKRQAAIAYGVIGIAYFAIALLFPLNSQAFSPLFSSTTAHAIAQCLISLQLLHLALDKYKLPPYFPLLSIGALTFTGSIIDYGQMYFGFGVTALVATLLLLLYFMVPAAPAAARAQRATFGRVMWRVCAVMVVVGMGLTVAILLGKYQEDLDLLFTRFVELSGTTTEVGLGDLSRLHSVSHFRARNEDHIAIRVVTDDAPGYLRARAFATYHTNQWSPGVNRSRRDADPDPPDAPNDGLHQFTVLETPPDPSTRLEIWAAEKAAGPLFAPLEASAYRVDTTQIVLDGHRIADATESESGARFEVYIPSHFVEPPPQASIVASALEVPRSVEPAVRALAKTLFADADTPDDKITAVMRYFSGYEYKFGITIPRDRDPLTYFLIDRPAAHCEFFASGAAILLRLGGVPTRYVTGFVPTEYNMFAGCWVARNKDAHAWVEAYIEDQGWVIVDATPGPGRPQREEHFMLALAWDAARFRVQELLVLLRSDIVEAFRRLLVGLATLCFTVLATTPLGWAVTALAAAFAIWKAARRWKRRHRRAVTYQPVHPMQSQVKALERRLRRHGVVRAASETLHHLAWRLDREHADQPWAVEAAAWLRQYANTRYGRPHADATDPPANAQPGVS